MKSDEMSAVVAYLNQLPTSLRLLEWLDIVLGN
jgi:hypothetical protein